MVVAEPRPRRAWSETQIGEEVEREYHAYSGWETIADFTLDEEGAIDLHRIYFGAGGLDSQFGYAAKADGGEWQTLLYLRDHQGSVVALYDPEAGEIVENYEYEPYGLPTITTADGAPLPDSVYENRMLFTGREWDSVLRMYHYRYRVYSPVEKRFIQQDPIGLAGGWNYYAYCGGDPVNALDPLGLDIIVLKSEATLGPLENYHTTLYFTEANVFVDYYDDYKGYYCLGGSSNGPAGDLQKGIRSFGSDWILPKRVGDGWQFHARLGTGPDGVPIFGNGGYDTVGKALVWPTSITSSKKAVMEEQIVETMKQQSRGHWSPLSNCQHHAFDSLNEAFRAGYSLKKLGGSFSPDLIFVPSDIGRWQIRWDDVRTWEYWSDFLKKYGPPIGVLILW